MVLPIASPSEIGQQDVPLIFEFDWSKNDQNVGNINVQTTGIRGQPSYSTTGFGDRLRHFWSNPFAFIIAPASSENSGVCGFLSRMDFDAPVICKMAWPVTGIVNPLKPMGVLTCCIMMYHIISFLHMIRQGNSQHISAILLMLTFSI